MTSTEKIKQRFDRSAIFHEWLDSIIKNEQRKKIANNAQGRVLEVGVGTGKNLPFYPADCEVTGIDFSSEMLKRARARARVKKFNLDVKLLEMDAQQMTFKENTFDTVIATCVFCAVPDPIKGLQEINRVCKPGGQVILLEHVQSEHPFWGNIMDSLNPVFLNLVGCNINRQTVQNVVNSKLKLKEVQNAGKTNILKLMIASPV